MEVDTAPPSSEPVAPRSRSGRMRLLLRAAAALVTLLVTVALFRALRRDGPAALEAWRTADIRWTWLVVSVACGLAAHGALIYGWRRLLRDSGVPATLFQTARLFLVSNLGRYLPAAKAWQMGIVGIIAAEAGLPPAGVAASSLFHGLVGVVVGTILLFGTGGAVLGIHPAWLTVPLIGVATLVAAPAVVGSLPRVRALVARRLPGVESVTSGTMWTLVWTCAASWGLWGLGMYALALGLLPEAGASVSAYVAAWIGPVLAGVAALVAPAGLGVRDEAMRTMLVASGAAASGALVVVVVARVWATVLEVAPAAVFLMLRRRRRVPSPSAAP